MAELLTREQKDILIRKIKAKLIDKIIDSNNIPWDTGAMVNSIVSESKIEGNTIIIKSSLDYAEKMEFGSPPAPLSLSEKEGLKGWAHRHGIENACGLIKGIGKRGIKVGTPEKPLEIKSYGRHSRRPFIRPVLHNAQGLVIEAIKEVLG